MEQRFVVPLFASTIVRVGRKSMDFLPTLFLYKKTDQHKADQSSSSFVLGWLFSCSSSSSSFAVGVTLLDALFDDVFDERFVERLEDAFFQ